MRGATVSNRSRYPAGESGWPCDGLQVSWLWVWLITTAPGTPPSTARLSSPTNWRLVQMYWNASEHIATPNAPRRNGSGALPSQQTGSQPGAVNRSASQIFGKNRSASTGGGDDKSISDRVRWPEPPQTSRARRAPFSTVRATERTTASATMKVGSEKRYRK